MSEPRIPDHLLESITTRLRPACGHIPEREFRQLVRTVAMTQWRFEQLSADDRRRLGSIHHAASDGGDASSSAA
jgi:hypothetical protein